MSYRINQSMQPGASIFPRLTAIVGTVILSCGVAAIYLGHPELEPVAIAGSLIILSDMLLFAYLVYRSG